MMEKKDCAPSALIFSHNMCSYTLFVHSLLFMQHITTVTVCRCEASAPVYCMRCVKFFLVISMVAWEGSFPDGR